MATETSTSSTTLYDFIYTKENKSNLKDYVSTPDEICQFFSASTTFLLHQLRSKYPSNNNNNKTAKTESTKLWVGNSYILLKNVNIYMDQLLNEMSYKDTNLSLDQILPLPKNGLHLFRKISRSWSKNYRKLNDKMKAQKRTESQYSLQIKNGFTKIINNQNRSSFNRKLDKKSKISLFNVLSKPFRLNKKSGTKPKRNKCMMVSSVTQTSNDVQCVQSSNMEPFCLFSNERSVTNWLACHYSSLSIAESHLLANTITLQIKKIKKCSSKLSVCDEDFCDSSDEL